MLEAYNLIPSSAASNIEPRYNIGRFQEAYFIRPDEQNHRLDRGLFEFVPGFWNKPLKEKKWPSFNATAEKLITGETKSFVPAWKGSQRGILPVSGFYEWPRPAVKGQPPFYITSSSGPILSLACIWSEWVDRESQEKRLTFAIVTTTPNALMASIPHHRCPVALTDGEIDLWMQGSPSDAETLLKPPADDAMEAVRVSSYVNKIGNEGPECITQPTKES